VISSTASAQRERLLARVEQREFDWLIPERYLRMRWLSIQQVAEMLGYSRSTAMRIAEETLTDDRGRPTAIPKLERIVMEDRDRNHARYTVRGVLLYLAERLLTDPAEWMKRVERLIGKMDKAQLIHIIAFAARRRDAL
jgi:predicted DNA-binding transcriptional regulator AlpA